MKPIDIFPWNNHFNTDIPIIDEQHRKLVAIINKLATNVAYASSENDISEILDELTDYTIYHFQTEEAIWNKYLPNTNKCKEHEAVHQEFVDRVVSLKNKKDTKPLVNLANEALSYLVNWLATHILETDRQMSYIVLAIEDGLSIEEAKAFALEKMSGSNRFLIDLVLSIYTTLSSNTLSLMRELKVHNDFEKKIRYQKKYRQLLLNLSASFINLPLDKIDLAINEALEHMATFVQADRAYIFHHDIKEQITANTYEWCADGISSQIQKLQKTPLKDISEWNELHNRGRYMLIRDVLAMPQSDIKDTLLKQNIKSLVTIPLIQEGICKGFVGFDAVKTKHTFTTSEIKLLELFANLLVNIEDRRKIEGELSHEKTFLKTLIQTIPDLIWLKDTEGRYLACNKRFEDFFGQKEENIVGKTDYDFVDKELANLFRANDKKAIQTNKKSVNEEEITFAVDGHTEVVLTSKIPMYSSNGKVMGVLGVARDITERKEHEHHLEYIAHYDALTGLANRVLFSDRINQAMIQTRRHGFSFAVVYLDLDGFKEVNDTYGHDYGDEFLSLLAQKMKKSLREGDTIARLGGDEFVVLLLDIKSHEDSIQMLQRLLEASSQKIDINKTEISVTSSLGVTFFDKNDNTDADQLLRQADQAMYQAKLLGKNRYHVFDALKDEKIRTQHESLDEIQKALENEEFVLYYQPKVNMKTGEIVGAEALIRWNHPERGILPPSVFLPIIHGNILCVKLGNWVLNRVMKQLQDFKSEGIELSISINVDAMQLQQSDFVQSLKNLLLKYPTVNPTDFTLEILETSALEDIVHISQIMQSCKELGIYFSLDDFGTGYSSLTYLKRLPATELKIDRTFVRDMLEDSDDLAILDGVIGLSNTFRRDIIAEGVESVEHGEMLIKLGYEVAQGYVIARPMPPFELIEWMQEYKVDDKWRSSNKISRDDLALLYAKVEHNAWINRVVLCLKNSCCEPLELDYHECRFGEWLYGDGMKYYRDLSEFQEVERMHKSIHEEVSVIINSYNANEIKDLDSSIKRVKSLSDKLIDSFKKFEEISTKAMLIKL